jgi:hypothetical protein
MAGMADSELVQLRERLVELELALEDGGWRRMALSGEREFSREGLRRINELARLMFLKNPLIQRGVNVQAHYVFGQGINIRGRAKPVDEIVQAFLDDPRNTVELTGHQAREMKEKELVLTGNLVFVFFSNPATGRVQVRSIPVDEIDEIIANPEDAREPWFYRRTWTTTGFDGSGGRTLETRTALYPDWHYAAAARPAQIGGTTVLWDSPVYHVRVNCLSDQQFGVSEVYAALDWARAYKNFLEDWATIVRAYSRFAWNLTVKGGAADVANATNRLGTTIGTGQGETNPPMLAGSTFVAGTGAKLEPVRTAGATTSAEDGRRLLLMVAAATGLPESFFGDVSVGTLATAKSLDRPTELKMLSRQTFWADVFKEVLGFVVRQAVKAGRLAGTVRLEDGQWIVQLADDLETGEPLDDTIDIDFPPILEHDTAGRIDAIVSAATLDGKTPAGTIDPKSLARMLLTALGEDDVDAMLALLFPEEGSGSFDSAGSTNSVDGAPGSAQDAASETEQDGAPTAAGMMVEAVRELREAVAGFVARYADDEATA